MSLETLTASSPEPSPNAPARLATTKYDVSAQEVELWSPWGGTGRPSTSADEARLVAELRERAGDVTRPHARQHVTSLVTALRNGLTAEQVLQLAAGLRPAELVSAYDDLDRRRAESVRGWQAIVDTPDTATLARHGPAAALLMPVVIAHLTTARLRRESDADALRATIHRIDDEVTRTVNSTMVLEKRLDAGMLTCAQTVQVGEMLYDAFGEGAWSLSTFLAPRVGTLVPARIAALLGEHVRPRRSPSTPSPDVHQSARGIGRASVNSQDNER